MIKNLALLEKEVMNERLVFTNQRVLFWERHAALVLSDLHIGKTAHFRKNGIAIPRDILEKDLARLRFLIEEFSARHLIINGDLLHAGGNSDVDFFCEWKRQFSAQFHLVHGNHDRMPTAVTDKLCLASRLQRLDLAPFTFVHEFDAAVEGFQINGHIHPGKIIRTGVKSFRFPCFAITGNRLLLPAFSEFTGLDTQNLPENAQYLVFTGKAVYEL